ncbi:methylated-DNA--[protein]-cysteine S-methyltransferase [Shewanella salipaludis]|nr:methylated-DNA--[protein]-cysteine S-methyltransferase [Shewanella salipaludis]
MGLLRLRANPLGLSHLSLVEAPRGASCAAPAAITQEASPLGEVAPGQFEAAKAHLEAAHAQLQGYFAGERQDFSLTLAPKGTLFQRQVWQALLDTGFGQVCSYSDIAGKIARPKAVRAVGAANGANPIAIIVPCHRIIGKNGSLTGYAYGLTMKQQLLALESVEQA